MYKKIINKILVGFKNKIIKKNNKNMSILSKVLKVKNN
jgi:hypothetical protein